MYNDDDEIQFLGGQDYHPSIKNDIVAVAPAPPAPAAKRRFWTKRNVSIIAVALVALVVAFFAGRYYLKHYYWAVDFDYPLSRSCDRIISDLEKSSKAKPTYSTFIVDSIDGVPMRMFDLRGLHASITGKLPSVTNRNIALVTQAWDYYTKDDGKQQFLGEFILNGNKLGSGIGRAGFVAMTDKGWQMGVTQNDSISDYVIAHHGSMFRQFALISAGEICLKQFALKGKVHRRALARKPGSSSAFYVETVNKESLYDFAEALADYGFNDAVYLTGGDGAEPLYRDAGGRLHGNTTAWKGKNNLLVFSK